MTSWAGCQPRGPVWAWQVPMEVLMSWWGGLGWNEGGGGTVLYVNTQGSDPTGSLSVNQKTHTTACLPARICRVLLCLTVVFQAEISKPGSREFTECDLKVGLRRNYLPGSLEKELPEREMARNRPNTINLLFTTFTTLTTAAVEVLL